MLLTDTGPEVRLHARPFAALRPRQKTFQLQRFLNAPVLGADGEVFRRFSIRTASARGPSQQEMNVGVVRADLKAQQQMSAGPGEIALLQSLLGGTIMGLCPQVPAGHDRGKANDAEQGNDSQDPLGP